MVAYLERCCSEPIRIDARSAIEETTLMAQILPFVRRRNAFDADATSAMAEAYDKAIGTIPPDAGSQFVIRELIAKHHT